jgi:hypothetical protein
MGDPIYFVQVMALPPNIRRRRNRHLIAALIGLAAALALVYMIRVN